MLVAASVKIRMRRGGDSNPRSPFGDTAFPVLHNRPLCHLSEKQPSVGAIPFGANAVTDGHWLNGQRGRAGLAGSDGFGRICFFALCDFRVRGFNSRHSIQSVAELSAAGAQVPPFRIARSSIGSDTVLIELLLKGGQLRAGSVELPFQVVSFHSHVGFNGLKQNQGSGFGGKTRRDCGKNDGFVQRRKCSMDLKNRLDLDGDVAGEGAHADGTAGGSAVFAPDFDH